MLILSNFPFINLYTKFLKISLADKHPVHLPLGIWFISSIKTQVEKEWGVIFTPLKENVTHLIVLPKGKNLT